MRRILIIILFICTLPRFGTAQTPWYQPIEKHLGKKYFFEVSAGGSMANFYYSWKMNNQLNRKFTVNPDFGFTFRVQLRESFSVAPSIFYENRGINIGDQISYKVSAQYLSLYMPLEYNWLKRPHSRTGSGYFISVAPYLGAPLSGKISYESYLISLSSANLSPYDVGAEAGVGLRIITYSNTASTNIRFKISFCQGFIDTYSVKEKSGEAIALNLSPYQIKGHRYNQLLKFTLGLEFPFKQKATVSFVAGGDGKNTHRRFVNIY